VNELPGQADVVVIGGGICGHAAAASLARGGARVVLIEKEPGPAVEASGRAQGSLRVQGREPVEFPLAREAMRLWADASEDADPDHDFELAFGGNAYVCDDETELPLLHRLVDEAHHSGLTDVELLTPQEARERMPILRGPFAAAVYSPSDGRCQPDKATRYFAHKAQAAGASLHYGVKAVRLLERGGTMAGVTTDAGTVRTTAVVLTAGVWTPYLADTVGVRVPIMPVGLTGAQTTPAPTRFTTTIRAFRFGARPRPDGRVVFSAGLNTTVDHALTLYDLRNARLWAPRLARHWHDVRLKADLARCWQQIRTGSPRAPQLIGLAHAALQPNRTAINQALHTMQQVLPDLAGVSVEKAWAGMVDMSADGMPIIDGHAGPDGLVLITGLSGHGLALGPVLGEIAAELALTRDSTRPIHPFRLSRFREGPIPIPAKMI
jgi:sarcosine oxidase, subunit beta